MPCPCRHYGPKLRSRHGTTTGPCRAWTVLFSVVLGPAHRISARWKSIAAVYLSRTRTYLPPTRQSTLRYVASNITTASPVPVKLRDPLHSRAQCFHLFIHLGSVFFTCGRFALKKIDKVLQLHSKLYSAN